MILAADSFSSNANLIRRVHELGYIRDSDLVLDPTYGRGNWWKEYRPKKLVTRTHINGFDFRHMNFSNDMFDVVAFDPPYVSKGGRDTSGIQEMDGAYGMDDAPSTPEGVQKLINAGLYEMRRVCKPNGKILVKCKNYISSGKFFPGVFNTQKWAEQIRLDVVDLFIHYGSPGPQPTINLDGSPRKQVHARNNYSVLFVFQK